MPGHAAERVVARGVGAVDAQRHRLDAGALSAYSRSIVMSGVAAGASEAPMPRSVAAVDQRLEVGPAQRVAAGEDDVRVRLPEPGHAVEEREALLGRQLGRVAVGHRRRAAVPAGEPARERRLPVDEHRGAVEDVALGPDGADRGRMPPGGHRGARPDGHRDVAGCGLPAGVAEGRVTGSAAGAATGGVMSCVMVGLVLLG